MTTGVTCAYCGGTVYGDDERAEIEATLRLRNNPDGHEEYVMHDDCYREATADWEVPD